MAYSKPKPPRKPGTLRGEFFKPGTKPPGGFFSPNKPKPPKK